MQLTPVSLAHDDKQVSVREQSVDVQAVRLLQGYIHLSPTVPAP
jgi:hypothetical protein